MGEVLQDRGDVRAWLAEHTYAPKSEPGPDQVGLEVELFPLWLTRDGRPAARFALIELIGLVGGIPGAARNPATGDGRPSWQLRGALITEEPGAQLEVAGPPDPDADTAVDRLEGIVDDLGEAFDEAGAGLATVGFDVWSGHGDLPVQLEVPRYDAMSEYFRRRGDEAGFELMSSTCSLQINLDLGMPEHAARRWLLANLASPAFTAAFAASPTSVEVNGRAMGWRRTDPTRTGVPEPLVAGIDDPVEHILSDALRADVMFVTRNDDVHPGEPGFRFADWVDEGHARFGRPTTDDLSSHLSTLWPEVRLRGYIEVRTVDSVPRRWRAALVALVVGLIYDEQAREAAIEVLEPHRAHLPGEIRRAARDGLGDPDLHDRAVRVLQFGHEGAVRLGILGAEPAAEFLETYTIPGRHLSQEFAEAMQQGPAAAFRWAEARS